jgi:hypothetical protein
MTARAIVLLAPLLLAAASHADAGASRGDEAEPDAGRTPLAVVDGEILYREDVEGAVAFRIYRHEVDIYSLLEAETRRRVEDLLLEREAKRRGSSVEALLEAVESQAEPVTEEEVDAYLASHPPETVGPPAEARARVRHYLTETRRIERRLALLERLRKDAEVRFLLPRPEPPRTEIDVSGAPARGPEEAPVTIVHFASFGSRRSAQSAERIARLREELPGRIRWIHRNALRDHDERGLLAARLGVVAQDAGRFWELHDRWFASPDALSAEEMEEGALEVGLGPDEIARARTDAEVLRRVKRDLDAARNAGVPREPTLFVNGRYVSGFTPYEELRDIVLEELGETPSQS